MRDPNLIEYTPPTAAANAFGVVEYQHANAMLVGHDEKRELESIISSLLIAHHAARGDNAFLVGDVALLVNEEGVSLQVDQQKIVHAMAMGVLSIVPMMSLPIARALTIMRGKDAAVPRDTLPRFAREAARKISADINALVA